MACNVWLFVMLRYEAPEVTTERIDATCNDTCPMLNTDKNVQELPCVHISCEFPPFEDVVESFNAYPQGCNAWFTFRGISFPSS